jgi:GNAT superfamily N-acetyltransferase
MEALAQQEVTAPSPPEFIQKAGMGFRWAQPEDVKFVAASWLTSAKDAWFKEGAKMPLPDSLRETVRASKRRLKFAIQASDTTAEVVERRLLEALFDSEMKLFIASSLWKVPPLVIFDEETPRFVLGWIHCLPGWVNYVYVKHAFRGRGFARALLKALNGGPEYTAMTRAGTRLFGRNEG